SPAYLAEHGEPKSLDELGKHHAVGFLSSRSGQGMHWTFVADGEEVAVRVAGNIIVNDTDAYVGCGLEGLGLIRVASYMVIPHLRSGRLRQVLPQLGAPTVPLSIMYPQNRHLSPTVRAFT